MPGLNLTLEEAQQRASLITVDSYDVDLDLTGSDKVFRTKATVAFDATPGSETFVDMVAETIHSAELNGRTLDASTYRDYRLPISDLKEHNTLVIDADFKYMHTGEGLHRSVDPADGKVYLYSQFEVPDARRVYPTFEQPDLKATFTFTVKVPKDWTVLSVSPTPTPQIEGDFATFRFAPTERISTYITAIIAGPYEGKTGVIRSIDGREIDLGVYCRASLAQYLDADLIMEITEQGFDFFENAYGIPYPFTKYDQIFVPEYNAGAMENAGCITFRDQYIFRSQPTDWELESRTNTILHELAHMWFGDLVTMKWWDDLWLNESFAEFMAHLATAEATRWSDAWVGFMNRKDWGLSQDQKPSTHPVKAPIRDLEDVEVNFDGITYAKGASVLRQMVAYVGRENFFKGLNAYLTKHAYANATLEDLLSELEAASGRDMDHWTKVWVEEAGVTTLRPEVTVDEYDVITGLDVVQEVFTPGASLRPHALIVAGYSLGEDDKVHQVFSEAMDVDGERTQVSEALGKHRPDLILVNDQDLAYAKIRLDRESLGFVTRNIAKFPDALTRRILIAAAWDMTRDGEMPATEFLDLALEDLKVEDSVSARSQILRQIDEAVSSFVAPTNRGARMESVASRILELAKDAEPGSDAQKMLVQSLSRRSVSVGQYDFIDSLYRGTEVLDGLDMSLDLRWDLLFALVRAGRVGEEEIAGLQAEDSSLTGDQNAARARATVDSDSVREKTWQAIMHDVEIPNDTRWSMAQGFWSHSRTKPLEYQRYIERFFDQLAKTWEEHTFHIASRLVTIMFPDPLTGYIPNEDIAGRAQQWLVDHTDQPESLRRLVAESRSDCERMLVAQKVDELD